MKAEQLVEKIKLAFEWLGTTPEQVNEAADPLPGRWKMAPVYLPDFVSLSFCWPLPTRQQMPGRWQSAHSDLSPALSGRPAPPLAPAREASGVSACQVTLMK
jgi:hypothetical protein